MFRKTTASVVIFLLLALLVQPVMAATGSPIIDKLAEVETAIYGVPQSGALVPRVESLEKILDGVTAKSGEALIVRINSLSDRVTLGGLNGGSLLMKLNAAEWIIFQTQTSSEPILNRLKSIEEQLLGQVNATDGLVTRVNNLLALVWPGGVLNIAQTQITPAQKVKIKLLTELNSSTTREGEKVNYQVVEDVKLDDKIVIARDSKGVGIVKSVKKAGPFGQSGQIAIDFGTVPAIDGTPVPITIQTTSNDKASPQELAAGASLGGMVLLGPVGLAAGYLVQGKSETAPVGTVLELVVKESVSVKALSLSPVK